MSPSRQGHSWTEADDRIVYDRFTAGIRVQEIANALGRSVGSIRARLKRLGLLDEKGKPVTPTPPFAPLRYSTSPVKTEKPEESEYAFAPISIDERFFIENFRDMMSTRLFNSLQRLKITDIRQAFRLSPKFLLSQKNFGRRALADLQNLERMLKLDAAPEPAESFPDTDGGLLGSEEESAQLLLQTLLDIISDIGLSARDDFILKARLGLISGYERTTLAMLGRNYSVSRERIRQIQKKCLRRLLHRLRRNDVFRKITRGLFPHPVDAIILHLCERHFTYPLSRHMAALLALHSGLYKKHSAALDGMAAAGSVILAEKRREARLLFRQERHLQRHLRIFNVAFDPPEFKHFNAPVKEFSRMRDINEDSIGRTGAFFSKKCQRDVFYESNEEYLSYQIMEESPKVVWYQEQPLLIPFHFFEKSYSYCPDLAVITDDDHCFIMEVKNREGLVEVYTLRKALAALEYLHPKGIGYILADSRGTTLQDLAKTPVPPSMADRFNSALAQADTIAYADFKLLSQDLGFSSNELCALIINHDLCFERFPFRISRLPPDISFGRLLVKYGRTKSHDYSDK